MVWFYKRDRAALSIETRYDNDTNEYVAVVVRPDGRNRPSDFVRERHFENGSWRWSNNSNTSSGCLTALSMSCRMAGPTNRR
jgi:hypothetical protein